MTLDSSLARTFKLRDPLSFDVRVDGTNVLNHVVFTGWNNIIQSKIAIGSGGFVGAGLERSVGAGRDHNQYGFSVWLAGAGLKHGVTHGATDDIGWKAEDKIATWYDFHATVLHLLGIDHERLTFYHNGTRRRLTNVHGEVLHEILA